jgi:glycerophosphoryl diester phosphodiesterase
MRRKRGIPTYLWVLNKEEDYVRAEQLGVDGIMTDYPTRLKNFLNSNNNNRLYSNKHRHHGES